MDIQICIEQMAELILKHRKSMGLSRDAFATLAGVGKTVVYDVEHAKSTVQLVNVFKILHALNIQVMFVSPLGEHRAKS